MNEIEQYQKASAEWMGYVVTEFRDGLVTRDKDETYIDPLWHPDTDLNQTGMIWERMRKNGRDWVEILRDILWDYGHGNAEDIKLATMKAFMSYLDSQ